MPAQNFNNSRDGGGFEKIGERVAWRLHVFQTLQQRDTFQNVEIVHFGSNKGKILQNSRQVVRAVEGNAIAAQFGHSS